MRKYILVIVLISGFVACKESMDNQQQKKVTSEHFGQIDGKEVRLYTLKNGDFEVKITNYGGIITSILMPDKNGHIDDIVMGFDSLQSYQAGHPYFGAIIGRYGNRIAKGKFRIGDTEFALATNNGPNSLHGGEKGFDKQVWDAEIDDSGDTLGLILSYISVDMEEGFPGTLKTSVRYELTPSNELVISYFAQTDRPTICNLTNHSYFNLNGHNSGDILSHELSINADYYTPVDESLIPTGELAGVEGTAFDFRTMTPVGSRISIENEQLKFGNGYDHNWVLTRQSEGLVEIAQLYSPQSGRLLKVSTSEPGVQFYTGNFLDGSLIGKGGAIYQFRNGLCLETQHFPDSPNQESFPSTLLIPGNTYSSQTIYGFSIKE